MKIILISFTAGVSLLISCAVIPVLLSLSHRFDWYDDTNHRKIHTGNIPRIGGIAIFIAFLAGFLAFRTYSVLSGSWINAGRHIWPLFIGGTVIHLTGLYDDFRNIKALYKLLLQILAACLVVFTGHSILSVSFPFLTTSIDSGIIGQVVSIIWIVGVSNAVNLIDGMDGLSSGVSAAVLIGLGVLFLSQGLLLSAAFTFSLLGGVIGFLLFNRPPAKLFMGDSGSLFIGFMLASLPLLESAKTCSMTSFLMITLLLIPVLDTFTAIFRRLVAGKPIHSADKEHLHHKLMHLGLSTGAVLAVIYSVSLVLAAVVMFWVLSPGIASSICLVGGWGIAAVLFTVLHFLNKKQKAEGRPS